VHAWINPCCVCGGTVLPLSFSVLSCQYDSTGAQTCIYYEEDEEKVCWCLQFGGIVSPYLHEQQMYKILPVLDYLITHFACVHSGP
jgi:hypothetical protein